MERANGLLESMAEVALRWFISPNGSEALYVCHLRSVARLIAVFVRPVSRVLIEI